MFSVFNFLCDILLAYLCISSDDYECFHFCLMPDLLSLDTIVNTVWAIIKLIAFLFLPPLLSLHNFPILVNYIIFLTFVFLFNNNNPTLILVLVLLISNPYAVYLMLYSHLCFDKICPPVYSTSELKKIVSLRSCVFKTVFILMQQLNSI